MEEGIREVIGTNMDMYRLYHVVITHNKGDVIGYTIKNKSTGVIEKAYYSRLISLQYNNQLSNVRIERLNSGIDLFVRRGNCSLKNIPVVDKYGNPLGNLYTYQKQKLSELPTIHMRANRGRLIV